MANIEPAREDRALLVAEVSVTVERHAAAKAVRAKRASPAESRTPLLAEVSAVLELRDVQKIYKMDSVEVPALKGISLKIMDGDFTAIIGPSGSGKSTMLSIIGALDMPTSGEVLLGDKDLTSLQESEIARIRGKAIGFVFQTFNLYPTLDVFGNIALPMRIHEFPEREIREKTTGLAKLVGLGHRLGHLPSQLSGGERQRVAIARALSADPSMVLADEPTGNLDTKTSHEILGILCDLHDNHDKTVVIVTHEHDIAAYAKRIIELKDGKIIYDGKNHNRKNNERGKKS